MPRRSRPWDRTNSLLNPDPAHSWYRHSSSRWSPWTCVRVSVGGCGERGEGGCQWMAATPVVSVAGWGTEWGGSNPHVSLWRPLTAGESACGACVAGGHWRSAAAVQLKGRQPPDVCHASASATGSGCTLAACACRHCTQLAVAVLLAAHVLLARHPLPLLSPLPHLCRQCRQLLGCFCGAALLRASEPCCC